jgi:3-methyladenine DNA glycosylase Tag
MIVRMTIAFTEIQARAAKRHGGDAALEKKLSTPLTPDKIAAIPDDRWLAAMTKQVFRAGFAWKVIEAKWDGFEMVFKGFDPPKVAFWTDEEIARAASDARIVRNGPKVKATHDNAVFVTEVAGEHGSFGRFVADWPAEDRIGLWDFLKKRGSRLGGNTGPVFLRFMGVDTFVFSQDVTAALIDAGVVDKQPTSKRDQTAAQEAFKAWQAETARPFTQLSQILALSAGGIYEGTAEA